MNRQVITRALLSVLLSIVIFYPFNPLIFVYFVFAFVLWSILIVNYSVKNNSQFYLFFIIIVLVNFIVLVFMKPVGIRTKKNF